jgi:hypothetical protein
MSIKEKKEKRKKKKEKRKRKKEKGKRKKEKGKGKNLPFIITFMLSLYIINTIYFIIT